MKKIVLVLIIFALTVPLLAGEFTNADQESRYQHLLNELRCVVCQNQSLADSNAELAQDLRDQVRMMIIQGRSDSEVTEFLVARYGDFVLYNPPFQPTTYLLWLGPLLLFLVALLTLGYFIRRHAQTTEIPPELTETERDKIKQVLDNHR
ncbi:MAG: hypothetical protein BWK79_18615 [Beggiatoa sp. IS2]|nr:MAG: hypothetical protein BWK79_18615 [Beggiatoa sp. IS2]